MHEMFHLIPVRVRLASSVVVLQAREADKSFFVCWVEQV